VWVFLIPEMDFVRDHVMWYDKMRQCRSSWKCCLTWNNFQARNLTYLLGKHIAIKEKSIETKLENIYDCGIENERNNPCMARRWRTPWEQLSIIPTSHTIFLPFEIELRYESESRIDHLMTQRQIIKSLRFPYFTFSWFQNQPGHSEI
jgi:hypothetical protein